MGDALKTICCYCGTGCGITVQKDRQGKLRVEGDKDYPVNKGMLCSKGMNLHYTVMDQSDRLIHPEMRYSRHQPRQRVSWDQAMERAAAVFRTLIDKYGPDSVGFYASGQCLTEEYYVLNKLVKGFIGTNNIDTNSRLCMSSAVVGYKMALGEDAVPISYEDLELADCIFVAGGNPAWCHPILWRRVEAAKAKNPDLKIIVTDPSFRIGHGAFLFRPAGCRQHQVRKSQGFCPGRNFLHHYKFGFLQSFFCHTYIRKTYQWIGTEDPDGFQSSIVQGFEHFCSCQSGLGSNLFSTPEIFHISTVPGI